MAQTVTIKETCSTCHGTGSQPVHPSGSVTCFMCSGTGKRTVYEITLDPGLDDIMDKCNDIKEKVDEIKELMDEHPWW